MNELAILRRLDFLLNEARSESPENDQAVIYTMRTISNYCTIGKDAPSSSIKKRNPRMSEEAYKSKKKLPQEEWVKGTNTINEHQDPLKQIWKWILDHKEISREDVLARFKLWPMVTVTNEENKRLQNCQETGPSERYREAKINVGLIKGENWEPLEPEISN